MPHEPCSELQNAVYFWWRISATVAAAVLAYYVHYYRQKLKNSTNEKIAANKLKRKLSSENQVFHCDNELLEKNENDDNGNVLLTKRRRHINDTEIAKFPEAENFDFVW